jgi:hypothetical protein
MGKKKHIKFICIRIPDGAMLTLNTSDGSLRGLFEELKKKALRKKGRVGG